MEGAVDGAVGGAVDGAVSGAFNVAVGGAFDVAVVAVVGGTEGVGRVPPSRTSAKRVL